MRIGEFTRRADVTRKAVRYYEARGALKSSRTPSGYREFDADALEVVRAIRAGQRLGLKLEDLGAVLASIANRTKPCADLHRLIEEKRSAIRQRIDELHAFDEYLQRLVVTVDADGGAECPIIARINAGDHFSASPHR
jgi:MerR family gold-responsive transcriptional activator of gol and ges genes